MIRVALVKPSLPKSSVVSALLISYSFYNLCKAMDSGSPINVQDALLRYTFDNICQVGFGVDPGCLAPDLPVVSFAQAFDEATKAS